jgi:uncharacterized alpha-E superfamily protein
MMMLSRVADSLYWIGRYCERAEHACRLLQITLAAGLEGGSSEAERAAGRAMAALGAPPLLGQAAAIEEIRRLTLSRDEFTSVYTSVARARENARQVRDQITTEMWERLNMLFIRLRDEASDAGFAGRADRVVAEVIGDLHAVKGIIEGTMSHGEGFRFLSLGRMIERAQLVARVLEIHMSEPEGSVGEYGWIQCLRMLCGLEPFLRTKTANFRREVVADFLVLDPDFPRSLRYCANAINGRINKVGTGLHPFEKAACQRLAGKLKARLDFAVLADITGRPGRALLAEVGTAASDLNEAVRTTFFTYTITTSPAAAA